MKLKYILLTLSFVSITAAAQDIKGVAELKAKVRWQSNDSFVLDTLVKRNMVQNKQKGKPASCKFNLGARVDGNYAHAETRNEVENALLARKVVYIGFENVPEAPFMPAPKINLTSGQQNSWKYFQTKYLPQIHARATENLKEAPYMRWFETVNLPGNEMPGICAEMKQYLSVVYRMHEQNITCENNTFSTSLMKVDWHKASRYYYFPLQLESCQYGGEEEIEWEN